MANARCPGHSRHNWIRKFKRACRIHLYAHCYEQRHLRPIRICGDPSLNNLGQVAFLAEPDFGEQVLLTGPDLLSEVTTPSG
jgi:hypothetical protein